MMCVSVCVTIIGAVTSLSSSSDFSKNVDISDIRYFRISVDSDLHIVELYSLKDIAENLNLNTVKLKDWASEYSASECLKTICTRRSHLDFEVYKEFTDLKKLPSMITSSSQKPDIMILQNDNVVFTAEVHSSPMKQTVTKACIGGADFFRLLRAQGINDIEEISTFAIPKWDIKTSIIEIKVSFSDFNFQIHLKNYHCLADGIKRLRDVIKNQSKLLSATRRGHIDQHYLIKLTDQECRQLCDSKEWCAQLPSSTHIIVETSDSVYKVIYSLTERLYYNICSSALQNCKLIISPKTINVDIHFLFYKYAKVKFSPLNVKDASKCLNDLVKSIKAALDELHALGFAHNDIRLPNICFDGEYQAILIDIDWITPRINTFHMFDTDSTSCMYRRVHFMTDGRNTDYMQLGWMVAWVLDHHGKNEHERKWETEKKKIKENQFIRSLVEEGNYSDELLDKSIADKETLKTVLENFLVSKAEETSE